MKVCKRCGQTKKDIDFLEKIGWGLSKNCKTCIAEIKKKDSAEFRRVSRLYLGLERP